MKELVIEFLKPEFSVCKLRELTAAALGGEFVFVGKTDKELSLVCPTAEVPGDGAVLARDDGWRAFRVVGVLDFSLIGILARISKVLADAKIGIFAVSTFNTDYVLVKSENAGRAAAALAAAGFEII